MKRMIKGLAATLVIFAFGCIMVQSEALAISGFARKYGLSCNTCHSVSFPRLNYFGEKFMRNGFQLPGGQDGSKTGKKAIAKDLSLDEKLGNMVGFRGKVRIFEDQQVNAESDDTPSTFGSTIFGAFFAAGTAAENMPYWAEFETNTANGETELHNFFIGLTNIGGYSAANVRVGAFTPTEWTSFSDQKRSLDAPGSHPGAFRPGKFSKTGTSPYNLRTTTGIEYFGYTGPAFWAVGVADKMGGNYHASHDTDNTKDAYIVLRGEAPSGPAKGSSVSFLAYRANNGATSDSTTVGEFTVYDVSANLRAGGIIDLFGAYVWDSDVVVGDGTSNNQGITLEGDVELVEGFMGILRFDTFKDGAVVEGDARTTYVTPALVYAPKQNLKVTASFALDASDNANADDGFGERNHKVDIETQFMF